MRHELICAVVGLALTVGSAQAATDNDKDAQHPGWRGQGARPVGALAGHETGSGHSVAATGAAIGHHDKVEKRRRQAVGVALDIQRSAPYVSDGSNKRQVHIRRA